MNLEQTITNFCVSKSVDVNNAVNAIESFLEQMEYDLICYAQKNRSSAYL